MKIGSAEFCTSAYASTQFPEDGFPEIAFLGRSNVGKSSLLNSLLQRRGLARTSNTPGRTQSINFYRVNGSFYFVDLPGYGFAKVSKQMRADWGKLAEDYLSHRDKLVLAVQLVDARHEPSTLDRQLNEWLLFHEIEHIVVATKADKLSNNKLRKHVNMIGKELVKSDLIAYSSVTGRGWEELWDSILSALKKT